MHATGQAHPARCRNAPLSCPNQRHHNNYTHTFSFVFQPQPARVPPIFPLKVPPGFPLDLHFMCQRTFRQVLPPGLLPGFHGMCNRMCHMGSHRLTAGLTTGFKPPLFRHQFFKLPVFFPPVFCRGAFLHRSPFFSPTGLLPPSSEPPFFLHRPGSYCSHVFFRHRRVFQQPPVFTKPRFSYVLNVTVFFVRHQALLFLPPPRGDHHRPPVKKSVSSHDGTHVPVSGSEGVAIQRSSGTRGLLGLHPHLRLNVVYGDGERILLVPLDGVHSYFRGHHIDLQKKKEEDEGGGGGS